MTSFKLEPEQVSQVVDFTKVAAEQALVGRRVVDFDIVPVGTLAGKYKTINDTNETTILFKPGGQHSEESMIEYDWNSFPIWKQRRHYDMSLEDMSADSGEFQDDILARTIRKMANVEDKVLLSGWLTSGGSAISGATGLEYAAGSNHGSAASWITTGDPYAEMLTGLEYFDLYNIPTDNMQVILAANRLRSLSNIDSFGNVTIDLVEKGLGIPKANFFPSGSVTATNVIMYQKDPMYAKALIAEDFQVIEPVMLSTGQHFRFNIVDTMGIKVKETYAIHKITGA